jgi:hypothetical protein
MAGRKLPTSVELEKSGEFSLDEKNSTFTVLVTGQGVSRAIHLSIASSLISYALHRVFAGLPQKFRTRRE